MKMTTKDEIMDLLECIAKFDSTESFEVKGRYFEQIQITAQQLVNKNLDLLSVMRCSFCGDEIRQGEHEYVHKKGFGCCTPEETEKEETHYELFGTTDCDPQ